MTKTITVTTSILIFCSVLIAQTVIENPEKPQNKNAGRLVNLTEMLRIDDIGSDYYFKYPRNPKVSSEGYIFVQDYEQLIQFDSKGIFIRNYFKKGQGPGEMQEIGDYLFADKMLIVHDRRLLKIICFDFEGALIKELKLIGLPVFSVLHHFQNDKYYFFGHRIPSTEGKPEVVDVPLDLIYVSENGEKIENVTFFPVESFVISGEGSGAMASIAELITVPFRDSITVCHTQNYLIKIFDLESEKINRSFRRKYKRVKVPKGRRVGGTIGVGGKTYSAPRGYLNDISRLFTCDDHLWVMTSTVEKEKGVLVDVFNFDGEYIDNFYLKIPGIEDSIATMYTPMTISHGFLFRTVRNEDDTFSIIKYKIEGK